MRKESKFRLWKTLEVVVGVVLVGFEEAVGEREERREKASTIWHSVFSLFFPILALIILKIKGTHVYAVGRESRKREIQKKFIERKKPNTKANRFMYVHCTHVSILIFESIIIFFFMKIERQRIYYN